MLSITKPLLERKRRARINRCLDELKDLMFTALEAEGENVDKLEKADILEFTVKHLQKITRRDPVEEAYKFQEGFSHCASEACSFLLSLPGLDSVVGRRLVEYLAKSVSRALESQLPAAAAGAQKLSAAAAVCPTAAVDDNDMDCGSNAAAAAAAVLPVEAAAVARGLTPPSTNDPPAPPPVHNTAAAVLLPSPCTGQTAALPSAPLPAPPQKPFAALTSSNRGPHTVVRPKPTRPAFGHQSAPLLSPGPRDAGAAAAGQRDPMWRPW
ncbi:Hypothetical protein CINCED_3A007556 [Cinara cedri]|uniref:Orange domain,Myc-type, basic helix-loop-helix (BHLH) domain n=1 Tax=Cinara cedri TaxID=506608 RepID=A0A5E4MZJ0_9HEMI|nr:Hypothetical protein CINCED_3A007556 [Cinara cedri]